MGWSEWSYWRKGSIITFLVFAIMYSFLWIGGWIISEKCVPIGDVCYDKYNPILVPFQKILVSTDVVYYIVTPFVGCSSDAWFGCELWHIFTIPLSIILISIILGWLYGKWKNRKVISERQ